MKQKKLILHTLSGFEGAGKSTVIDYFKNNLNYFVIPETARLILPLQDNVLKDSKDDLSYKSFISYLTNLHFLLSNDMKINCISDRNLIDSLTYLELYSKEQKIDISELADFIFSFLENYNRNSFYDNAILILHPKEDDYIKSNILSDPDRQYGKNVSQYKEEAKIWEDIYMNIANKLQNKGLFKNLKVMEAYPENQNIISDVVSFLK
jgi:predicted ATPase